MASTHKSIPVSDLWLDIENPRFEKAKDQNDAIEKIFELEKEKIINLAKDIAENGLDPTQMFIALPNDKHEYIILEGNRRLVCLICLNAPARAPDQYRSAFKDIVANQERPLPKNLECSVFDKREEANRWIKLRHTGENKGVGVSSWDTEQQRRFDANTNSTYNKTLQLVDWLKTNDPRLARQYGEKVKFTNLERLIDDKHVREALGLEYEGQELYLTVAAKDFLKGLERIINDFSNGMTVDAIKKKEDRAEYIRKISDDLPEIGAEKRAKVPLSAATLTTNAKQSISKTERNNAFSTDDPRHISQLLKSLKPKGDRAKVVLLLKELQTLKIEKHPHAFCFILRAMFEVSAKLFCEADKSKTLSFKDKNGNDKALADVLTQIVNHLIDNGKNRELKKELHGAMRELKRPEGLLSITTLNQLIHSPRFSMQPKDICICFSNIFPLLKELNK